MTTLAELQDRFRVSLDTRLRDIAVQLHGGRDREALSLAFHSLAGIGGTYGHPRITDISRKCEAICKRELTKADVEQLELMLRQLRASVAPV